MCILLGVLFGSPFFSIYLNCCSPLHQFIRLINRFPLILPRLSRSSILVELNSPRRYSRSKDRLKVSFFIRPFYLASLLNIFLNRSAFRIWITKKREQRGQLTIRFLDPKSHNHGVPCIHLIAHLLQPSVCANFSMLIFIGRTRFISGIRKFKIV